ncbi:MAG: hypothetical protein OXB95_11185 [Rhodobacteraceae bacterium]|nr:hypothetical protein [Paracoccaceae bacterium]
MSFRRRRTRPVRPRANLSEQPERILGQYSPAALIPIVGGLLTMPEFHASSLQVEALQHFAVKYAKGKRRPPNRLLARWLNELERSGLGRVEVPSENLVVSRVSGSARDYLVFGGRHQYSAFHLQRFVNVLNNMPSSLHFGDLKRSAEGLLALSDEVVRRSGVEPFSIGVMQPLEKVPNSLIRQGLHERVGDRVVFDNRDLARLRIRREDIGEFILNEEDRSELDECHFDHTSLERHPLIAIAGKICLALPGAVSMAIRRMVIEWCLANGYEGLLNRAYANEIAASFGEVSILGDFPPMPRPTPRQQGSSFVYGAETSAWIDEGRLLNIHFVVDNFADYDVTGTFEENPMVDDIEEQLTDAHADKIAAHSSDPQFREGLTLVVTCAWGRPMFSGRYQASGKRWRLEGISAPDLMSLSRERSISARDFWSLLDTRDWLQQNDVIVINFRGLLNLHANFDSFDSSQLTTTPDSILLDSSGYFKVHRRVALRDNVHRAMTWDRQFVRVRRFLESPHFQEDAGAPLYISLDHLGQNQLAGVLESDSRSWWVSIETPNCESPDLCRALWEMLCTWVRLSASAVEKHVPSIPQGPIAWTCLFQDTELPDQAAHIPTAEQADQLLQVRTSDNVVRVTAQEGFLASFRIAENDGERLLVERFVAGTCSLSDSECSPELVNQLVERIVPDKWVRSMHAMPPAAFRDFFANDAREKPILLSKSDVARARIEVGWQEESLDQGGSVEGNRACSLLLRNLANQTWSDIRGALKGYNCDQTLLLLLHNHESARIESDLWSKAARAALSLHRDRKAAELEAASEISKLNESLLCTRLLAEIALCECPRDGGLQPGRLDLLRLFASVGNLCLLGWWFDEIEHQFRKPLLQVTPLGDMLSHDGHDRLVVDRHMQILGTSPFRNRAASYLERFPNVEPIAEAPETLEPEFLDAWREEFGFSVDDLHAFMDNLDQEGIRRRKLVFSATESEVCRLEGNRRLDVEIVNKILEAFALFPRSTWAFSPDGYSRRDVYPWRHRRRLSPVRRPLLCVDKSTRRYLIAPGMVRDGMTRELITCYTGNHEAKLFPKGSMRSWIGAAENKRGRDFSRNIAAHLESLGWKARVETRMTHILNAKLDRDYGDIDVLAWKAGRVVAIECKDFHMAKAPPDIALQLHDFAGQPIDDEKPDRLRRHHLRLDLLNLHLAAVRQFVGDEPSLVEGLLVVSRDVPMDFVNFVEEIGMRIMSKEELATL